MSDIATFFLLFAAFWAFSGIVRGRCRPVRRIDDRRFDERRIDERTRSQRYDATEDRIAELTARLERLEEERDFYRDLLGSGTRFRQPDQADRARD